MQNNENIYTWGTWPGEFTKIKYNGIECHLEGQSSRWKLKFLFSQARTAWILWKYADWGNLDMTNPLFLVQMRLEV